MLALYGFLALGSHYAAAVSGESSQFSPDEVGTYTAAISTGAARTLIDKISVAAVGIHNEPEMRILEDLAPPSDGGAGEQAVLDGDGRSFDSVAAQRAR